VSRSSERYAEICEGDLIALHPVEWFSGSGLITMLVISAQPYETPVRPRPTDLVVLTSRGEIMPLRLGAFHPYVRL
jgi:hypothetical protein